MLNPDIAQELGKAHRQNLMREAEHRRLVRQVKARKPSLTAHLLERMGGLLIKIGGQLQERHAPQSTGTLGWVEK